MKLLILISAAFCGLFLSTSVLAQRDYFTDEEVELIRDAQQIDQRMDVLIHAIDRRFSVLKVDVAGPNLNPKDKNKDNWGPLPTGTRMNMLSDIKQILQKAIDDIDSLAERPNSAYIPMPDEKKPKHAEELFPNAVRKLAKAAERYRPALEKELDASKDAHEQGLISSSIEMCDEIVSSVTRLPAPATPSPKNKKDK
jgi:hypothetical protein